MRLTRAIQASTTSRYSAERYRLQRFSNLWPRKRFVKEKAFKGKSVYRIAKSIDSTGSSYTKPSLAQI